MLVQVSVGEVELKRHISNSKQFVSGEKKLCSVTRSVQEQGEFEH